MQRKNISIITVFESFLCAFVVFIHVVSKGIIEGRVGGTFWTTLFVCQKLVSFVVPAFIFASALKTAIKYAGSNKRLTVPEYIKFMWGRILRVYIPYLVWVFIFYLYFVYDLKYFEFDMRELVRYTLKGTLVAHFYFIIIIMQFYILMPLILWCCKRVNVVVALVAAFEISLAFRLLNQYHTEYFKLLDASSVCFFYLIFWVMGTYAGLHYEKFAAFIKSQRLWLAAHAAAFAAAHIYLSYKQAVYGYHYAPSETVHLLFCVAMTIGFIAVLDMLMPLFERCMGFFKAIAGVSFYVYLSHILAIFAADKYTSKYELTLMQSMIIRTAAAYILPFALSFLYVWAKKKVLRKDRGIRV